MNKFILKEEFPSIEMELFSKTYPCYLSLSVFVVEIIGNNLKMVPYNYETEYVNGQWLLKTKI